MDNLTHGLFGLAIGALRKPDGAPLSATDKAVLVACVVAAELPDFDYLWPAGGELMRTLQAHRGPSHSLLLTPLVALLALGVAKLIFRTARPLPVFGWSLLSVALAHLLPDLWTGWGTRVLWPFSEHRLALDWTGVIDPLVTLPLLLGALLGWRRPQHWRAAVGVALALSMLYIGGRVVMQQVLKAKVVEAYPQAQAVNVFPAVVGVSTWRYVATFEDSYALGRVSLGGTTQEEGRQLARPEGALPELLLRTAQVSEAVQWARFPVVRHSRSEAGGARVSVADLRYHMKGEPTLTFVVELGPDGEVLEARLERGGKPKELFERWRSTPESLRMDAR